MLGRLSTLGLKRWSAASSIGRARSLPAVCQYSGTCEVSSPPQSKLRNVAIIAHVDHGKTTLVDRLLATAGTKLLDSRAMDSMTLEKERGITIQSKYTRVQWGDHTLNIVDTPGHQDFGGEVERILSMVEGVVVVVDASEGPMTQTKFVLTKAIQRNLKALVVLNKVDRNTARLDGSVENDLFDLFCHLGASEEQLNFPVLYASARNGFCVDDISKIKPMMEQSGGSPRLEMGALLDAIVETIPAPLSCDRNAPFQMLVTSISSDPYVGRISTGKIQSGEVQVGDMLRRLLMKDDGSALSQPEKVMKLTQRHGLAEVEVMRAGAGDIVSVGGIASYVTDSLSAPELTVPLDTQPIDPPTIQMTFSVNDSPLCGKESREMGNAFRSASQLKSRLMHEVENNVAIRVEPNPRNSEALDISGRGELQLGILLETLRREGFELKVTPPRVLEQKNDAGVMCEPVEEVVIDSPSTYSGAVIANMQARGAEMKDYKEMDDGSVRVNFHIRSRALLGARGEIKLETHGEAVVHSVVHDYVPTDVNASVRKEPVSRLVSVGAGTAKVYSLKDIEARGTLFIAPMDEVYQGMVIGNCAKRGILTVNPCKEKKATNVRSSNKDDFVRLVPAKRFSIEEAILMLQDDESIEITPKHVRLRKNTY